MDTILQFLTGVLRYVLPVLALLILAVCVISLFRNRPRVHKMAQLVDQNNGSGRPLSARVRPTMWCCLCPASAAFTR